MPKLQRVIEGGVHTGYYFDCPGCESGHFITVRPHKAENGASWEYNGNIDSPTFSPSILSRWQFTSESGKQDKVCHSYVTDGKIQFLGDCTHALAGQTVDMLEVDFVELTDAT